MDRERLKAIIRDKCKNLYSVAEKMDIKRATFSKKINQTDGFDFTKCEKLWGEEF